jgi:hypothetical protein
MANDFVDVSTGTGAGGSYLFGFAAANAPTITGFTARAVATSDSEPEVFVTAINGEGHVEAVAISKTANKKLTCSFTGYVTSAFFDANGVPVATSPFTFFGRKFFIKKISAPRQKGAFIECSIDAESYPLIT